MPWTCFVIRGTERHQLALRRFHTCAPDEPRCGANGYHEAIVPMGEITQAPGDDGYYHEPQIYAPDDPRWPTRCDACGAPFGPDDMRQHFTERLYVDDAGHDYTLRTAPAGALYRVEWVEDHPSYLGPDGQSWALVCPPGGMSRVWLIDGPSSSGGRWTRTGTAPRFTVSPSVWVQSDPEYHGFLRDGVLTDDINGRTY